MSTLKGQTLYREGEPADYVYLVKEGQYEVTRTMTFNEDLSEKTKKIFSNPMRAQKVTGSKKMSSQKGQKHIQIYVINHRLSFIAVSF